MIKKAGFIFLVLLSLPLSLASAENSGGKWSYKIENGLEKSERSYLLVYYPKTEQERYIEVISQCQLPYPGEGTYGKCTHKIKIQPTKAEFTLNTGEDVALIRGNNVRGVPLILSTIEYGCCGGPDLVRFYDEYGKYLGRIDKAHDSYRPNYDNVITREFNFGNLTSIEGKMVFIFQDENNKDKYYALINEAKDNWVKLPVFLNFPNKSICPGWYLSKFIQYGDRKDLTLVLEGTECEVETKPVFSCSKSEEAINCLPVDNLKKSK